MNETEPMYKFYIIIALEITVKLTIKTRNSSERSISSSSYSQLSIDASSLARQPLLRQAKRGWHARLPFRCMLCSGHGMQLGDVIMRFVRGRRAHACCVHLGGAADMLHARGDKEFSS